MIAGCIYKRLVVGAKGWEQVPCISLYREFGNLTADGCDYVCRSRPKTVVEYVSNSLLEGLGSLVEAVVSVCPTEGANIWCSK